MRSDSKRLRRAGLIVAIGALCAACAAGGYDAGAVRRHLIDAGVSPAAADCVVLHMGPRFGEERLGARADPSAAEIAAERALMRTCGVKLSAP
jgi:hypothetical protein